MDRTAKGQLLLRRIAAFDEDIALKAVAHKLARACYHMIKEDVAFDITRAFG